MDDYIPKPVDMNELKGVIRRVMSRMEESGRARRVHDAEVRPDQATNA